MSIPGSNASLLNGKARGDRFQVTGSDTLAYSVLVKLAQSANDAGDGVFDSMLSELAKFVVSDPTYTGITGAANVEDALKELKDAAVGGAASDITVTPAGNLAAANVALALTEHQGDIDGILAAITALKATGVATIASNGITVSTVQLELERLLALINSQGQIHTFTTAALRDAAAAGTFAAKDTVIVDNDAAANGWVRYFVTAVSDGAGGTSAFQETLRKSDLDTPMTPVEIKASLESNAEYGTRTIASAPPANAALNDEWRSLGNPEGITDGSRFTKTVAGWARIV